MRVKTCQTEAHAFCSAPSNRKGLYISLRLLHRETLIREVSEVCDEAKLSSLSGDTVLRRRCNNTQCIPIGGQGRYYQTAFQE